MLKNIFDSLSDSKICRYGVVLASVWAVFIAVIIALLMISCTVSFQNISTHGTATDLVDEDQAPTNTISPSFRLPINP